MVFGAIKPTRKSSPFEQQEPNITKYGISGASEIEDFKIGPYCDPTSCIIPHGIGIGNDNLPVSLFFSIRNGRITGIDVSFNASFWDEIVSILDNKYGAYWSVENGKIAISDYGTRKYNIFDRITLTHKTGGMNAKTHDKCEISATNYDMVFKHHDPLGSYHSLFVIKLVSKNF